MTARQFQNIIFPALTEKLFNCEVRNEWTAFNGFINHYSPRVDIAVGPFSVQPGLNQMQNYNNLVNDIDINIFLRQLYEFHIINIGEEVENEITIPDFEELIHKNQNARCFLAIEIENQNSKKHIMGSMINAASLGRIGIGVAYNNNTLRTFIRIMNYLGFLRRVEKNTYDTTNFLIITKDQLAELLNIQIEQ